MDRIPKLGEFYRHFKDKLYQIIAVAEHTETGEMMVVYQALYGDYKVYTRPLEMFVSEVDHEKYPEVQQKYRFEQVVLTGADEPTRELNRHLLSYIEAETCEAKLEYLAAMRGKITREEVEILYVAEDMKPVEGEPEEQLRAIEQYLLMQKRFEGGRLR